MLEVQPHLPIAKGIANSISEILQLYATTEMSDKSMFGTPLEVHGHFLLGGRAVMTLFWNARDQGSIPH